MSEARESLQIGSVLDGRYELIEVLGKGAYGMVYKARQISTGQPVAIKVLLEEKLQFSANASIEHARFQREMELIARLKHPNIVRLIDTGSLGERGLYMVLEFIEGINLADHLKEGGALSPRVARHLMSQVLDALSCAHALGIVHRDLKPHNIMVTTTGSRQNAMVLDFGIAGILESARKGDYQSLTAQSQIQGTPAYMAPEYIRDKLTTPQGDIYAWGLVFTECLTGDRVVKGANPLDVAMTQGSPKPIELPASIADPHLRHVLQKALAKPLTERYADAASALVDLEEGGPESADQLPALGRSDAASTSGVVSLPPPPSAPTPDTTPSQSESASSSSTPSPSSGANPLVWVLVAIAVLAVLALVGFYLTST